MIRINSGYLLTFAIFTAYATQARADDSAGVWIKGDFHVHSLHSNDAKDSPVASVIAKAEANGFDFMVITDHDNHVEGNIQTWDNPDYRSSKLTLLYGVEWTTGKGHANILGAQRYDYSALWQLRDSDLPRTLEIAHDQDLHFSVNHPAAKDLWEPGFDLDIDSMEVWTAVFSIPTNNRGAIKIWDKLLASGKRMAVRGGSDSHHQKDAESILFNIGNPTTWILAKDKSGPAILDALKKGRASISYAPKAERIELLADSTGQGNFDTAIGDSIACSENREINFRVNIVGARPNASYKVEIYKNGQFLRRISTKGAQVDFKDQVLALNKASYRIEVFGDTPEAPWLSSIAFARFVGMTNPIYVNNPLEF